MILENARKSGAAYPPPPCKPADLSPNTGNASGVPPPSRKSVFGRAPLPHEVSNVSFQRVPAGDSVAYAIISNGHWLGTLSGANGRAFRDHLLSLPRGEVYDALVQVARRMAADLHFGGTADNNGAGQP
jgi:hypothetical protein